MTPNRCSHHGHPTEPLRCPCPPECLCRSHKSGTCYKANTDPVQRPAHYNAGKVECIDAIEAAVASLSGNEAFLTGQIIKYVWRWKLKNGGEDLRKAKWYLDRLLAEVEKGLPSASLVPVPLPPCTAFEGPSGYIRQCMLSAGHLSDHLFPGASKP